MKNKEPHFVKVNSSLAKKKRENGVLLINKENSYLSKIFSQEDI